MGPPEMGMNLVSGHETAVEMIPIAYGLEEGLARFYRDIAKDSQDRQLTDLLNRLADIEERHKQKLFDLYLTLQQAVTDKTTFETDVVSERMEGGFTVEEFKERMSSHMGSSAEILDIAMMIETQALDLYLRFSQKVGEEATKEVLFDLAEEEKGHMAAIGRLMEELAKDG